MTNREKEIINLLKLNPMMSQQNIADKLGIERSSVGVHLSNLTKKGIIKGKGYIINDIPYVVVIGGSNMDILGTPLSPLVLEDSNPGKISLSLGGVGRNIAENLVKLDISTKLLTAIGEDIYGDKIYNESLNLGIDMEHAIRSNSYNTSTYLSILEANGNMKVALSDMEITSLINEDYIKQKRLLIKHAQFVVIDTNINQETINYIVSQFPDTKFILDTVSTHKAIKAKDSLQHFYAIKPNILEAEILSGINIQSDEDIKEAIYYFKGLGIEHVIITLGKKGVAYLEQNDLIIYKNPPVKVINSNGAGDTFTASMIYALIHQYSTNDMVRFASTAAMLSLESEATIHPNMSVETITHKLRYAHVKC